MILSAMWFSSRRFRNKPLAFWCIGARTLDVAVIRSAIGEPLLSACAGLDCEPVAISLGPAAGVFELASSLGAMSLGHVVALDRAFCRLTDRAADQTGSTFADDPARVRVAAGCDAPVVCDADRAAATTITASFRALGLRLLALDCAPCAELSLAAFLGEQGERGPSDDGERICESGRLDPFAAVSVAPEVEDAALAMGTRLIVPVGLALGHLGWVRDA